ncbi:MAG: phosphohistidine phosphatase SixA [Gemmatimonadota bacterium]
MELILWRHAEAEAGEPDLARRLTAKGEKQARRAAEWLHAQLPDAARLLVSPAIRAQQTARPLAEMSKRRLKTVERLAPGATVDDVLAAANWPDGRSTVVIVGHQPVLGRAASRLLAGRELDWAIKKGGLWWISSRARNGEDHLVLRAVISPDLL